MSSIGAVGPAAAVGTATSKLTGHPAGSAATASGATDASGAGAGGDAATAAQVKAAVEAANQQLNQSNRELAFVFDDKLGRILVKIVDRQTNTVVRQVPSEEMLAAARALSGTNTRGALLKSKA